jgi:hypothetical protein
MSIGSSLTKAIAPLVFIVLTAASVELALRVYFLGPAGIYPSVVNSFTLIFRSDMVEPADHLDIWYQLKPNLDTIYHGAKLTTNTRGLRDREYTIDKPDDTYRVAVVGSSWTMGTGVANDEIFHALLEQQLNAEQSGLNYEFINFGVEYYGLGEIMATVRHKALAYDPDMIMLLITDSTPRIRWSEHTEAFVPPDPATAPSNFYTVLMLNRVLGFSKNTLDESLALRSNLDPTKENDLIFEQQKRAFNELKAISAERGIDIATVRLRSHVENGAGGAKLRTMNKLGFKAAVVTLDDYLEPGEAIEKLLVNRSDPHPNSRGHKFIAAELRQTIFGDAANAD